MEKRHVAVLAFPFATHAPPLLHLVRRILDEAPPPITFSFLSTAKSNEALFSSTNTDCVMIRPFKVDDGLPENYKFSGNPREPVDLFLKAAPENFRKGMKVAEEEVGMGFSCIICDAFFWFVDEIAAELRVPWFALWTASPRSLICHVETDLLREKHRLITNAAGGDDEKAKHELLEAIPGMSELRMCDIPREIVYVDAESPGALPATLRTMGLVLPSATAVTCNSFEELDPFIVDQLKSKFHGFLNIGPFVLASPETEVSDPHECLAWLDKQRAGTVAYISFGSMITPPLHEITALAEALEASSFPFIWSFRGNPEEQMPEGFLQRTGEKGKVVAWTPQLEVLKHKSIGVFLTHSGWNSILESIVCGVPLICRPFIGDQPLNARTVEAVWGIGTGFAGGKISKDGAVEALTLTLTTEKGKEMRKKLEALKEKALAAVEPNGNSTSNFQTLLKMITSST